MKEEDKRKQTIKISVFITSIFVILFSVTYAFINVTLTGTRRQVITAGNLSLELVEDNEIKIDDAFPMYDEVGILQNAFNFRLINNSPLTSDYTVKLVEITDSVEKLDLSIIRYGLTKDGVVTIGKLSELENLVIDTGTIGGSETIEYSLRLWIDSSVEDNNLISGKTLKYKIGIEAEQLSIVEIFFDATEGQVDISSKIYDVGEEFGELPLPKRKNYNFLGWYTEAFGGEKIENKTIVSNISKLYAHWEEQAFLSTMKQGDYVAYVGANGCQNNGIDITGEGTAESKNSCLGWNANQVNSDTESYGYCRNPSSQFITTGWRIAYIENNQVHLISAGSPECNERPTSVGNLTYINLANKNAKKYCNSDFVDGDCSDNSDSWALTPLDYNKITAQMTNTSGGYLYTPIGNSTTRCDNVQFKDACGHHHDLINNGGNYWLAAAYKPSDASCGIDWSDQIFSCASSNAAMGLRPIIQLSASVRITGGSGTMNDPYTIIND